MSPEWTTLRNPSPSNPNAKPQTPDPEPHTLIRKNAIDEAAPLVARYREAATAESLRKGQLYTPRHPKPYTLHPIFSLPTS